MKQPFDVTKSLASGIKRTLFKATGKEPRPFDQVRQMKIPCQR